MTTPLPPIARRRTLLFGVPSVGTRWPAGIRAALAFGIPAMIAFAIGFPNEALLTVAGGFALVYGEGRAYRIRPMIVLTAGVGLVLSAAIGGVAGETGSAAAIVVAMVAVGVVSTFAVDALRLGPPGAFFFVLVCGIATILPRSGVSTPINVACVAIGVASALVVTMSGVLWRPTAPQDDAVDAAVAAVDRVIGQGTVGPARHLAAVRLQAAWATLHDAGAAVRRPDHPQVQRLLASHVEFARVSEVGAADATDDAHRQIPLARPSIVYRLRRATSVHSHAGTTALRVLVASSAAGVLTIAFGLDRPDWAVVSSVLVLQAGLDRRRGSVRGVHRLVGTVVGLVLFVALFSLSLGGVVLLLVLMVLQFLIELMIARNYAIAVTFITPLALLIGGASRPGADALDLGVNRLVETALRVACALASMWVVAPRAYRRWLPWCDQRVLDAADSLLDCVATVSPSDTLVERRDLQFELVGAAMAAVHAAHDDRDWAAAAWPGHDRVDALGYELLAQCWATPVGMPFGDVEQWRRRTAQAGVG